MQYRALMICKEPVAAGFSCATSDAMIFDYEGVDEVTPARVKAALDDEIVVKRCDKCFSNKWDVFEVQALNTEPTRGIGD